MGIGAGRGGCGAGGLLTYGIPGFKLEKQVVMRRVARLESALIGKPVPVFRLESLDQPGKIYDQQILTDGKPAGDADRRALATSGDSDEAVAFVTALYDEFGFDTVNVGPLKDSWRVERDQPAYVVRQTREELTENLRRATR